MIKLKDLLKETITQGGVVSRNPWIKEQDDTPKINVKELVSQINNFSKLGEAISGKDSLKGIAETLSSIAEGAAQHTLSETDDMFDKVPVIAQSFNVELRSDHDYISTKQMHGSIKGLSPDEQNTLLSSPQTWAPTLSTVSVGVVPVYSRESLTKFSLQEFANGTLNQETGIGFI